MSRAAPEGVTTDLGEITALLEDALEELRQGKRRHYGGDWEDWENGTTGVHGWVVYCLWAGDEAATPEYVGQTVNLGHRLWQHFAGGGWREPEPTHVSYVSRPEFEDAAIRILFERLAIAVLRPEQNSSKH